MEEHWDLEADRSTQVTLAVGSADKPARDVVVVTDFGALCFILFKLVTADVAPSGIIIFLLLAGTKALYRQIPSENRYDLSFPHDERVKKLGESVLFDFHHSPFVKVIETRSENGRGGTYFVLLSVGGLSNLAIGRLKNGLKVSIDDKLRFCTILVLVEFDFYLLRAWHR